MEIKKNPLINGAETKPAASNLKIKMSLFLMNYFNFLVIALGLIILIAVLAAVVYPKYRQITLANEEAKNNLMIEYETKFKYLTSIRDLKKSYQSINDEEKTKIADMLPVGRDTNTIITEIESIALKNGVTLNSIKIEPEAAAGKAGLALNAKENQGSSVGIFNQVFPGVGQIKIEISLSSVNYSTLKNIIKTFENNLRLFDIAGINFNAGENLADLSVYSYYLSK